MSLARYTCFLFNARSLKNKLPDFHFFLYDKRPDIVIVTETWFNSSIIDGCIINDNPFTVFRTDRQVSSPLDRGGGVCILTNNNSISSSLVALPIKYNHLELCVIDVQPVNIRLFALYRPPGSNRSPGLLQYTIDICDCISSLLPNNQSSIICGDFNFPDIDWHADNCLRLDNSSSTGVFLSLCIKFGLSQLVNYPTRNDNILDLILTNDPNSISNIQVSDPFCLSDHNMVSFDILSLTKPKPKSDIYIYNFNNADWPGIIAFLSSVNFFNIFSVATDVNDVFNLFYNVLDYCISVYVPVKCIRSSKSKLSKGPRYPIRIRRLLNNKRAAWALYRRYNSLHTRSNYNKIAASCRKNIRLFISSQENKTIDNGNIGSFYRHANKKLSSKSTIGPIRNPNNILITHPSEKANIFQNNFISHFITDNGQGMPFLHVNTNKLPKLESVNFSSVLVFRAINKLKLRSKGGPDGIPPIFYKKCISALSLPLSQLFSISLSSGYVPPVWLKSYVVPIYKKGDRTDPNNYRPIALTCTMSKLMESVIKDQLLSHLKSNNLISTHQHAFLRNRSTTSNLLQSTYDWLLAINSSQSTDVIYIDFRRAFDSIVFSKLLFKLRCYGVSGVFYDWLFSYLHNRQQCVVLDNCFSSVCEVSSGVPQGSVLGPVLFLIFINDIDSVCNSSTQIKIFADDLKLYSITNIGPSHLLQLTIDKVSVWADVNQLDINIDKCCIFSISNSRIPITNRMYFINGVVLTCSGKVVDLGIEITHNLSFKSHIVSFVSKAYQRLSLLFRGFVTREFNFLRKVFITYIRPLLEYNSVVWSPTEIYLIDLIEKVQRYFTRNVPALADLPYSIRLSKLNLQCLELRRLQFDLIYYYKIFHNLTPLSADNYFLTYLPPQASRNKSPYLIKPAKAKNKLLSFLSYRSSAAWNALPEEIKSLNSIKSFKNSIRRFNFNSFLIGNSAKTLVI